MKIELQPNGLDKVLVLASEKAAELYTLGRISARVPSASTWTDSPTNLEVRLDMEQVIKLLAQ